MTRRIQIAILASIIATGCKDDPPAEVDAGMVDAAVEEVDEGVAIPELEELEALKWEGDFSKWHDVELKSAKQLPECPTGWFNNPVDDEFVAWKCSNYKGMELGDVGQFTVHTRNERIFMVSNAFDFEDQGEFDQAIASLRKINESRRIPLKEKHTKIASELWNLDSYVTLLSTGSKGMSLLYLHSKDDVETVYQIVERQGQMSRLKKKYRLGDMEFKILGYRREDFVGRGRERWDSKKVTDFVIVDYQVRNMKREFVQLDPAKFTIIGKNERFTPDERAEHAFFTSDKTGRYKSGLEYRKIQDRAHVFEIDKESTGAPMILVVSVGDDKRIYRIDLRSN